MKEADVRLTLQEIESIWRNTSFENKPIFAWICLYKDISNHPQKNHVFNTSVDKVWIIDRNFLVQRERSEYLRFYFAQLVQPWNSFNRSMNNVFSSIGLICWAKIYNSQDYCLHWQFKSNLGEAFTYKISPQGLILARQQLFIS